MTEKYPDNSTLTLSERLMSFDDFNPVDSVK